MTLPETDPKASAAETAAYIGGLARELQTMAERSNLGFLASLLGMVVEDAEATARDLSRGENEKRD
jgi:hypothetical protein